LVTLNHPTLSGRQDGTCIGDNAKKPGRPSQHPA